MRGSTRVRLQSQPLLVLEALLAHPGEMLSREQLIARLWPTGVIIDFDTALNSAVRRLRTALDDHAENPRYIETIPRRGYRFIGHLHPDTRLPTADGAMSAVETRTELASPPTAKGDEATARLRAWGRGRSVLLTSAFVIGVAVIVAGALSPWAGRPQTLVAPAPTAATEVANAVPIPPAALERYERARFLFNRREAGDAAQALALFEQALRIEPRYARAWAGIASVRWIDTMERRIERSQGLELTRAAAEQALELDPGVAEAHLRLANYYRITGDLERGNALVRRAEALEPNDPLVLAFKASDSAVAGRFDEAVRWQRRAVQAAPLSVAMRRNLAVWLYLAGHFQDARVELAQSHAISGRDDAMGELIGQLMLLVGESRAALDYAIAMPEGPAREQTLALAYHALGRRAESDAALKILAASVPDGLAYKVAEVHAYRGENDMAFEWLQRFARAAPADCDGKDCWPVAWVPSLPLLQSLRRDPRWLPVMNASAAPVIKQASR